MTDQHGTAEERAAAEEGSAFSHEPVAPDATRAYGDHPDQVVDFFAPPASGPPAPLVVVVHGGAWRAPYDRRHITPFAAFLARRGFAVAVPEYRRGGAAEGEAGRWPETLDDVAAALDALPRLAADALGGRADPGRTVLTGHSAGGHLVLWGAARHVLPAGSRWRTGRPPALRGVVALAPVADFAVAGELGVCGDAASQFLGGPELFEERRPHADPVLLLPTGIATTVVQGRDDLDVPPAVAESYADAAARAGEVVGLTLLEGVGHFPLIDPAAGASAVVAEEIAQLAW
jgi:acetyl esterase/lipase